MDTPRNCNRNRSAVPPKLVASLARAQQEKLEYTRIWFLVLTVTESKSKVINNPETTSRIDRLAVSVPFAGKAA
jgi:hypothetical protein